MLVTYYIACTRLTDWLLCLILTRWLMCVVQACQEAKRDLQIHLEDELGDGRPVKDIVSDVRDIAQKHCIPEQEVIALVGV